MTNDDKLNVSVSSPILYTDAISMQTNEDGVILDVIQRVGDKNLQIVSRIGMSREHAKKVVKSLGELLAMTEGQMTTKKN